MNDKVEKHNALIRAIRAIYGMDFTDWPDEVSEMVDKAHSFLFGRVGTEF